MHTALLASEYSMESANEFNGEMKRLEVRIKNGKQNLYLRSDGEFTIYRDAKPICYFRLEMDMGIESGEYLKKKFFAYHHYRSFSFFALEYQKY
ncbi:hypothetical protein [Candidatus Uabimicrobium amorphum]|uniref:Uncharacterized protein n=1 Tax=Uabimicrobium amorphum TaxID=2596890 RepID=A0A5S9IK07_UABAM|nr:hypothetical protein [Candidatus Uabimicrobium amorphum]BBM83299.1 hypothetical protein UABAM_01650 [Candidatus Uabimicrobium amorphum]